MESKTRGLELDKAFLVASATEWEGDMRVNFMTAMRSCRVLARYCKELEDAIKAMHEAKANYRRWHRYYREE